MKQLMKIAGKLPVPNTGVMSKKLLNKGLHKYYGHSKDGVNFKKKMGKVLKNKL